MVLLAQPEHRRGSPVSQSYSQSPQYAGMQQPPARKGSGLAVASLVLGILALVFSLIPFINVVAIVLGIIGLVLGAIGIFKSSRTMAIIGSVLSLIAIIVSVAITGAFASAVDEEINGSGEQVHVVYTIESDSPTVSATYTTLDGGNIGQSQDTAATPPWTVELDVTDSAFSAYSLTASMNPVVDGSAPDGSTITCRITVDGEVVAEQVSTGQYAIASCNAS